jgi:phosphate transport system substrate-binding protein
VLLAFSSQVGAVSRLDPDLPRYQKVRGVAGNLSSVGSDSLANLMTFWAEEFKYIYSNVNIQVQAAGSSTAPPALAEGTVNLGPMSRKMKRNELQAFEQRYGYAPTAVPVAIDALAVYVHADNPLVGLSLKQLDAIFSSNQDCGAEQPVESWGQLGLTGVWERRDLQLFGRNSVSGTYGYFKLKALCGGDFRNTVNEQPGSASVVQSVATSIGAIGYSGIGYRTASVRSVPLLHNGEYMDATAANAVSGNYPLARYLYIYVNKPPNQPLPLLEREFVKMVLSRTGQKAVVKDGYIPLPEKFIARQRALLDL